MAYKSQILAPVDGGTGISSYSTGDILYTSSSNTLSKLPINEFKGSSLITDSSNVQWGTPNSYVYYFDDFFHGVNATVQNGCLFRSDFFGSSGGVGFNTGQANTNPGVLDAFVQVNGDGANFYYTYNGSNTPTFFVGGGLMSFVFYSKVSALSSGTDTYILRIGLGDQFTSDFTNGIYFEYTDTGASHNWLVKTANSSTRTSNTTSNVVDTNFHKYEILINAAASSVSYFIDNVQCTGSPITTHIPSSSSGMVAMWQFNKTSGSTGVFNICDFFSFYINLTTPRGL
jgi:hypothetical protein